MKKNFGFFSECICIFAIIIFTIPFVGMVISDAPTVRECQETAKAIETIENTINDPTQWKILSISEDYSECEVQHGDGNVYIHPIYQCWNEDYNLCVVLEANNGELHEFAVWTDRNP